MIKLKPNHVFRILFRYQNNAAYTVWTHAGVVGKTIRDELARDGITLLGADLCEGDFLKEIPSSPYNFYRMGDIKHQQQFAKGAYGYRNDIYYPLTCAGADMQGTDACINTIKSDIELADYISAVGLPIPALPCKV